MLRTVSLQLSSWQCQLVEFEISFRPSVVRRLSADLIVRMETGDDQRGGGISGIADGKKGLLLSQTVAQLKVLGIDVSNPKYTCEDLFGSLSGSAFLDAVCAAFGEDERDIPWFVAGESGKLERTIRRSPLSRPIQHSTAEAYKHRICKEGLSQLASGHSDGS